jgi:hypothetical protein
MNQKALTTQEGPSRFALLQELESSITTAFRRGLNAAISMGNDFDQIREKELYRERSYESFGKYVEEHFGMSRQTAERLIGISRTARLIQDAGLMLPTSEAQIVELAKLEPERQKIIWKLILDEFPEKEITTKIVRLAVEQEERRSQSTSKSSEEDEPKPATRGVATRGVQTALDMDNGQQDAAKDAPKQPTPTKTVVPGRITLTQEGEDALDRIRALCGDTTAEGIEKGNVSISERDLIKWAEQSDVVVRNLEHYICNLRWSVRKALEYEERIIDGESTLNQLIVLARARGGRAIIEHQDYNEVYTIRIERTKILQ